MTTEQPTIYRDENPAEVIGWVSCGGCENENCRAAIRDGRAWHAIPAGFGVGLDDYHYATRDDAVAAIQRAMADIPGRDVTKTVGEDHAWRTGKVVA